MLSLALKPKTYSYSRMPPNSSKKEVDPLLIKSKSSLSDHGTSSSYAYNTHSVSGALSKPVQFLIASLCVAFVFLGITFWQDQVSYEKAHETNEKATTLYDGLDPASLVEVTDDGKYTVRYPYDMLPDKPSSSSSSKGSKASKAKTKTHAKTTKNATTTPSALTFGDLAAIMLPPWHAASMLALDVFVEDKVTMVPSNKQIGNARLVLRKTRDLLDVFSPVYPTRSMWTKLRNYYKNGYELVGYFHDLNNLKSSSKEPPPPELVDKRRSDVLEWKTKFLKYHKKHDVLSFLISQISATGCFDHTESHLYWRDLEFTDTDSYSGVELQLPCANDLATPSLGQLAVVQLNHALDYFQIVMKYKTILSEGRTDDYHNLRKELRVFLDEYDLFDFVMLSSTDHRQDSVAKTSLDVIEKAVEKIGVFHDKWTAYDIYVTKDTHHSKQKELAAEINEEWEAFKKWTQESNLEAKIRSLIELMEQEIRLYDDKK